MADILFVTFSHLTKSLNGAEMYHHNLAKWLQSKGHSVRVVSHVVESAGVFDGVPFGPFSGAEDAVKWCDIVVTVPGKFRQKPKGKDVIFIQHNQTPEPFDLSYGKVIYCAEHVRRAIQYSCIEDAVLWPFNRYAGSTERLRKKDGYIALFNCNNNKGGLLLKHFAEKLPNYQFMGVRSGYGVQHQFDLPNLTYIDGTIDIMPILAQCNMVIMPSLREGLPTLALEATALGVPVVMNDIPAAHELNCLRCGLDDFVKRIPFFYRSDVLLTTKHHTFVAEQQLSNIEKWFVS